MGPTALISKSLVVSLQEADEIIDEQASIGLGMMANDRLDIEDVEELMYDMGIEPDNMDDFLMRMI